MAGRAVTRLLARSEVQAVVGLASIVPCLACGNVLELSFRAVKLSRLVHELRGLLVRRLHDISRK